jgi:hypothetical protein
MKYHDGINHIHRHIKIFKKQNSKYKNIFDSTHQQNANIEASKTNKILVVVYYTKKVK